MIKNAMSEMFHVKQKKQTPGAPVGGNENKLEEAKSRGHHPLEEREEDKEEEKHEDEEIGSDPVLPTKRGFLDNIEDLKKAAQEQDDIAN